MLEVRANRLPNRGSHRGGGAAGNIGTSKAQGSGLLLRDGDPMPLIGRSRELDRILSTVRSASGSALAVTGGHGTGKSALLAEIPALSGSHTVFLAASASETGWPLSGLTALLAAMDDPVLDRTAAELPPGSPGGGDVPALAGMLLGGLHRRTSCRTVIVIDDADQLDARSQAVIGYVARRLAGTEITLVISLCTPAPYSPFSGLPALHLESLDYGDTVRLLAVLPEGPTTTAAAHAVAAASNGNPLAAVDLYRCLAELHAQGTRTLPVPLPRLRSLEAKHAAVIGALSPHARQVLDLLSLSFRSDLNVLAEIAADVWPAVDELVAVGVAARSGQLVSIRDQLLRGHVFAAMAPAARTAAHRSLAQASEDTDAHGHRWHLSFAAPGQRTPFRLLRTAADLVSGGEVAFAVECVERALTISPCAAQTAAGLARVAELLFSRGEFAYAGRYLDWALHVTRNPGLTLRLTGVSFQIEFIQGGTVRPAMVLRLARELGMHDPAYTASLLSTAALYFAERWEFRDAQELLQEAARFQDAASAECQALSDGTRMLVSVISGRTGGPGPQPAPAGDTRTLSLLVRGRALSYAEHYGHAQEVLSTVLNSREAGDLVWRETAALLAADNDIRAGNVRSAVARIDGLERNEPENRYLRGMRHVLRVWRAHALGDEALAQACAAEAQRFAGAQTHPAITAQLAACQGQAALLRGDLAEALAQLCRAVEVGACLGSPTLLRCEGDLVEVLVRLGRYREAGQALLRLESRSVGLASPWLLAVVARSRAMLAEGEQSLQLFGRALEGRNGRESVLERGRTLLCFAERLTALGRIRDARSALVRARVMFEEAGADAWTHHVTGLLLEERAEPAGQRGNPALLLLADHERALAKMVARGMRNKEIAATLYVSVRTVEVRLTAIYRKLGVESRAQLTALAAGKVNPAAEPYVLPAV